MSVAAPGKVVAYITQDNRLLVFRHPLHPEAGIQVPAGTIKAGESPHDAVLREAQEETGLGQLELRAFLGMEEHDLAVFGVPKVQQRHFYHLEYRGDAPPTWQHYETDPSEGEEEQTLFEFFWAVLPDGVPELHAGQDALLPALLARLAA